MVEELTDLRQVQPLDRCATILTCYCVPHILQQVVFCCCCWQWLVCVRGLVLIQSVQATLKSNPWTHVPTLLICSCVCHVSLSKC